MLALGKAVLRRLGPPVINAIRGVPPVEVERFGTFAEYRDALGLAFLTLIPAIRRGGGYIKGNGSPWRWPLYPWSLFFFLGLGVCARSYYLCVSLHNVEGFSSIFGPYFLVPFGFAIALLLLEAGLTSRRAGVVRFALMMPVGLLALAMVGHRTDAVYERFLALFQQGMGVAPPAATLLLSIAFFAYAAYRSAPLARGLAMAALVALSVVGPGTIDPWTWVSPQAWPLAAVGLIQVAEAIRRPNSWRVAIASAFLVIAVACWPGLGWSEARRYVAAGHLATLAMLMIGVIFKDEVAELSRRFAAFALSWAALAYWVEVLQFLNAIPTGLVGAYPWILAAVAAGYGVLAGGRTYFVIAGVIASGILVASGSKWYLLLRQQVAGLDRIVLGLASFGVAALISLRKSGVSRRRLEPSNQGPLANPHPIASRPGP